MAWKEVIDPKSGKKKYVNEATGEETTTAPEGFGQVENAEDVEFPESMTDEEIKARKDSAKADPAWAGSGEKVGLEIWRVENKWIGDTPDFGVARWPDEKKGLFYKGDSYIVLKTTKDDSGKLVWDVHFWIGGDSTQDEYTVAAYKAVELDCVLDGLPTQHREVMGAESKLFLSYFTTIEYLDGGIESGFRSNEPESYTAKLLRITRAHNVTRAFEVPCEIGSMSQQDTFVLDTGLAVYIWSGSSSTPFEKSKAGFVRQAIVDSRFGKAEKRDVDDLFWSTVGGDEGSVQEAPASAGADDTEGLNVQSAYEIDGRPAKLKKVEWITDAGKFDSSKVYLCDDGKVVYIWVGEKSPSYLSTRALEYGDHYRRLAGRLAPLCRVSEGDEDKSGMVAALTA